MIYFLSILGGLYGAFSVFALIMGDDFDWAAAVTVINAFGVAALFFGFITYTIVHAALGY